MNRLKGAMLIMFAAIVAMSYLTMPDLVSAQGSAALSIVPKKHYTIEPGKSINDTLTIRNQDRKQSLHLTLRVVDFTDNGQGGAPKLLLDEDEPQTTWSLRPFLKLPETLTIAPGTSETIDMSIAIPAGYGGGSYYSAIVYSSGSSDGGNVGLSASGVTLVFTDVPGKVDEKLTLEKLGAYRRTASKDGGEYAWFLNEKPEMIAYTLKNEGNVTGSPVGSITLKPLIGKETVIQNINPNGSLALRGQTRVFTSCIKLKSQDVDFDGSRSQATTCTKPDIWPGYYQVELSAFYGRNGNRTHDIIGKASFWYLPWWFILVSLIVLAYLSYRVWRIVRYVKTKSSHNQFKKRSTRRK